MLAIIALAKKWISITFEDLSSKCLGESTGLRYSSGAIHGPQRGRRAAQCFQNSKQCAVSGVDSAVSVVAGGSAVCCCCCCCVCAFQFELFSNSRLFFFFTSEQNKINRALGRQSSRVFDCYWEKQTVKLLVSFIFQVELCWQAAPGLYNDAVQKTGTLFTINWGR